MSPKPQEHQLYVRFQTKNNQNLEHLLKISQKFPGETPVVVYFADSDEKFLLKKQNYIAYNTSLRAEMTALVGANNFIYQ